MKRACVIGWPIEHSRSPLIHGYWLQRYGIEGRYTKEAVHPDEAAGFLKSLGERGFVGCNVTVPLKEIAFKVADDRETSAMAVGAANTLWLRNGRLRAANTDSQGFIRSLYAAVPDWPDKGGPVCVLGAGGAARAIVHGFWDAGIAEIRVFNRDLERAQVLAAFLGEGVAGYPWSERHECSRDADVLVNATSAGLTDSGPPLIDVAFLPVHAIVCDIVYVPIETALLRDARSRGLRTVGGLGMLLHQAVPGFHKWFGVVPEVTRELYELVAADIAGSRC